MSDKIKICMVGLGSIGKKHIHNIVKVLHKNHKDYEIDALRSNAKKVLDEEIALLISKEYFGYEELPSDYDVIFVTNPTAKHFEAMEQLHTKTKTMFIEKPLFENKSYSLEQLHLGQAANYYVACPLRHKAIIAYAKKLIDEGEQVYAARAISSSYLPEWRKGADYRQTYSAQKNLGGGVTLDLIHEWDYLTYLFGMPDNVAHIQGHFSKLEMDSDDISIYIAQYQDKTVEVHLDYFGRKAKRCLELYCENYTMRIDLLKNRITYETDDVPCEKEINFPEEDFYLNEMEYFYQVAFEQKENINSITHAKAILDLALC